MWFDLTISRTHTAQTTPGRDVALCAGAAAGTPAWRTPSVQMWEEAWEGLDTHDCCLSKLW